MHGRPENGAIEARDSIGAQHAVWRALMPSILERNQGSTINIASEAGVKPLPQMIHYSMTKSANISI